MTRRHRLLLTLMAALVLVLAACGGAAPAANDPAGVVRNALSLASAKDITGLTNLACAAQKDEIADSFTGGLGEIAGGIDAAQVLQAMTIDTSKVTVGTATESGDTASVPLSGSMSFSFDTAKMRDIMKLALAAQGQPTDDATIDAAMAMLQGFSGQAIPMDGQTMDLVKEGGAWKICDQN